MKASRKTRPNFSEHRFSAAFILHRNLKKKTVKVFLLSGCIWFPFLTFRDADTQHMLMSFICSRAHFETSDILALLCCFIKNSTLKLKWVKAWNVVVHGYLILTRVYIKKKKNSTFCANPVLLIPLFLFLLLLTFACPWFWIFLFFWFCFFSSYSIFLVFSGRQFFWLCIFWGLHYFQ